MSTPLSITSTVSVTLLIDMSSSEFTKGYKQGVHWRLYGWHVHGQMQAQGPLPVRFLVNNLQMIAKLDYFDGKHDHRLRKEIGYCLGMYHGGVLSPCTGMLRSDFTTLATFDNLDARRGYSVGLEWYFLDAEPHELRRTEASLIEQLQGLVLGSAQFNDDDPTWHYAMGCLLWELSGQLFPETPQESQEWQAQRQKWLEEYSQRVAQGCDSDPLPAPFRVYTALEQYVCHACRRFIEPCMHEPIRITHMAYSNPE